MGLAALFRKRGRNGAARWAGGGNCPALNDRCGTGPSVLTEVLLVHAPHRVERIATRQIRRERQNLESTTTNHSLGRFEPIHEGQDLDPIECEHPVREEATLLGRMPLHELNQGRGKLAVGQLAQLAVEVFQNTERLPTVNDCLVWVDPAELTELIVTPEPGILDAARIADGGVARPRRNGRSSKAHPQLDVLESLEGRKYLVHPLGPHVAVQDMTLGVETLVIHLDQARDSLAGRQNGLQKPEVSRTPGVLEVQNLGGKTEILGVDASRMAHASQHLECLFIPLRRLGTDGVVPAELQRSEELDEEDGETKYDHHRTTAPNALADLGDLVTHGLELGVHVEEATVDPPILALVLLGQGVRIHVPDLFQLCVFVGAELGHITLALGAPTFDHRVALLAQLIEMSLGGGIVSNQGIPKRRLLVLHGLEGVALAISPRWPFACGLHGHERALLVQVIHQQGTALVGVGLKRDDVLVELGLIRRDNVIAEVAGVGHTAVELLLFESDCLLPDGVDGRRLTGIHPLVDFALEHGDFEGDGGDDRKEEQEQYPAQERVDLPPRPAGIGDDQEAVDDDDHDHEGQTDRDGQEREIRQGIAEHLGPRVAIHNRLQEQDDAEGRHRGPDNGEQQAVPVDPQAEQGVKESCELSHSKNLAFFVSAVPRGKFWRELCPHCFLDTRDTLPFYRHFYL